MDGRAVPIKHDSAIFISSFSFGFAPHFEGFATRKLARIVGAG